MRTFLSLIAAGLGVFILIHLWPFIFVLTYAIMRVH